MVDIWSPITFLVHLSTFFEKSNFSSKNSFNNDDLLDDTDVIEEVETSDSEGEDY